jgi:hypothetical protein
VGEKIICIFCGKKADIITKNKQTVVSCRTCKRETELSSYQKMFDKWMGDIRKEANNWNK